MCKDMCARIPSPLLLASQVSKDDPNGGSAAATEQENDHTEAMQVGVVARFN